MIPRQDLRKYYIKEMFAGRFEQLKTKGIWFNGFKGEGIYKEWYNNGQLYIHGFYRNGTREREFRQWHHNGILRFHRLYRRGKVIKVK